MEAERKKKRKKQEIQKEPDKRKNIYSKSCVDDRLP